MSGISIGLALAAVSVCVIPRDACRLVGGLAVWLVFTKMFGSTVVGFVITVAVANLWSSSRQPTTPGWAEEITPILDTKG
jgi:hypothetical protein